MLEEFEERITMLESYRDLYEMIEERKSWYNADDESMYATCHIKAIENVLKMIEKLADI